MQSFSVLLQVVYIVTTVLWKVDIIQEYLSAGSMRVWSPGMRHGVV